jgi:hypothetical protein
MADPGIKTTTTNRGYQQITSLSSATGLTIPGQEAGGMNQPPVKIALLQCESQSVRWRDDGTNPTASVGMILNVGDAPYPYDGELSKIKFIETAASAKLSVSYYS